VTRVFRNRTYCISIVKSKGVCKGVAELTLNGRRVEGNVVPAGGGGDVVVRMG